jgi:hypothetical protein
MPGCFGLANIKAQPRIQSSAKNVFNVVKARFRLRNKLTVPIGGQRLAVRFARERFFACGAINEISQAQGTHCPRKGHLAESGLKHAPLACIRKLTGGDTCG